jgi:hypothetical protein
MSLMSRVATATLAVVVVQMLGPGTASAQIGGLARKAKQAATKEAEAKVEEALPYTPLPAPEFDDRVLEITEGRLDQLLRGFDAEVAYAKVAPKEYDEQVKAWERDRAAYEKASEAYNREYQKYSDCRSRFDATEQNAADANEKALEDLDDEAFDAYVEALAERGEKVARDLEAGKSDPATLREREEFQHDVVVLQVEQQRRAQVAQGAASAEHQRKRTEDARLIQACGAELAAPTAPMSPMTGPEGVLASKGATAAKLTEVQYAILRERVMAWEEDDGRPRRMGFSQNEFAALNARSADLKKGFDRLRKAGVPL